jgi:glycosyltransferase involved in cell wall biosynthesis
VYTTWEVYRAAVRLDADLYHFHDPELIPVALLLRARRKRVIYDIHEDTPRALLSKEYLPIWARRPLGWMVEQIEQAACRHFSALVAATPAIASRFDGRNGKVIVIQNFPVLDELAPAARVPWSERECAVAYVGGIAENRGIRQMVEAMQYLPETLPVTLKLAGSFSPPALRNNIIKLPGWAKVDELGFVDRENVLHVLTKVKAGLVMFHAAPNHVEAQPNKLFEYMAAGIPVIVSDFPLWRQIIQDAGCGLLANPLDPKAIAEAVEYLLTHPDEAAAMGRRGREAIEEHYNWETEEHKLIRLYRTLVPNGPK